MAKKQVSNLCIVQFVHPGETSLSYAQASIVPWNRGIKHQRKYMCCSGKYMQNGVEVQDRLMFWGEWEPDSYIIKDFGTKSFHRYLQKPIWPCEVPNNTNCGTDPFVFNKPFIYDFCGQNHYPFLRDLKIGSLILFGFRKGKRFIIDTIFVVGDYIDYDSSNSSLKYLQNNIRERDYLAIEQQMKFIDKNKTYRCYFGATPQNPINGMYSFVPCRVFKGNEQKLLSLEVEVCQDMKIGDKNIVFEEVEIDENDNCKMECMIEGVNPKLNQGKKKTIMSLDDVKDVWNKIKRLTYDQGLLEGTRFYL